MSIIQLSSSQAMVENLISVKKKNPRNKKQKQNNFQMSFHLNILTLTASYTLAYDVLIGWVVVRKSPNRKMIWKKAVLKAHLPARPLSIMVH